MWGASKFSVCGWNPKAWPFKWKLLNNAFLSRCFIMASWFEFWRLWMKSKSVTIQMKAIEQYFPALLFIIMDRQGGSNLWVFMKWFSLMSQPCRWNPEMCDHSNRSSWAVHACGTVLFLFFIFLFVCDGQGGSNFCALLSSISLFGTKLRCFGQRFFRNKLHKDYYLKNLRPYSIHFIVSAIHHSIHHSIHQSEVKGYFSW